MTYPNPDFELNLLRNYDLLIGVDEVGRGAIAGPVAVGATAVGRTQLDDWPRQIRDSKLLSEAVRVNLAPKVRLWAQTSVGFASVWEIEQFGISRALAIAGTRAITQLGENSLVEVGKSLVLLDGTHNWLGDAVQLPVFTKKKADRDCVSVAAASVVAKVERDERMIALGKDCSGYGFEGNKGYASSSHIEALQTLGPTEHHRISWLGKILATGQLF